MPANGELNLDDQVLSSDNSMSNCLADSAISDHFSEKSASNDCDLNRVGVADNNNCEKLNQPIMNGIEDTRFVSHPDRSKHESFLRECIEAILNLAVFDGTNRKNKVLEWHDPEELQKIFDFNVREGAANDSQLVDYLKDIIKYSIKTGHPYFVNQLYSGVDPYALVGQWLTDSLNPSVYTYEVSPVFICMEEVVLREMRRIVGFPNDGDGDGIFCPGGSMSNGYGISCARFHHLPDVKAKGLSQMPRLVLFTSEDSHYSIQKLASFMGIGSDNVYKIKTDSRGKLIIASLEAEIQRALDEGAKPFMVSATAGTTVLGAYDPLEEIADICEKYKLWMHVDAAWGGGALVSRKYRKLLKGIERADSVTWNPHKLLVAAQQCSTFLTRHKGLLSECHSSNATYLFQKDKFYDTKYDTGDKHVQCGRRADVLKFWFMWKAKGTTGLEDHINKVFATSEYFVEQIRNRPGFEMVLSQPECTNISFWYIPPSLRDQPRNDEFHKKLHLVAPKIKERMMKSGSMMITYQPLRNLPNFFRLVLQNSALGKKDMLHFIEEIERLGKDL